MSLEVSWEVSVSPAGPPGVTRFDFGTPTSPVAPGWVRVTPTDAYDSARGYGFMTLPADARDRGAVVLPNEEHVRLPGDDLSRDFVFGRTFIFKVDVPNGGHTLHLITGDFYSSQVDIEISVNGEWLTAFSTTSGHVLHYYYRVNVIDGSIRLRLRGTDPNTVNAVLNALEIDGEYREPTLPHTHLWLDFGPKSLPPAPGYVRVSDESYYTDQIGYGWVGHRGLPMVRDRGGEDYWRGFVLNRNPSFRVDMVPGEYDVTLLSWDPASGHDFAVYAQGDRVGTVTAATGEQKEFTFRVSATEGSILLRLDGIDGLPGDENAVINALRIDRVSSPS